MGSQKGLAARIERKLEASVGDVFARLFGGSVVPQEVEALLRREAEDGVRPLQGNRLLAPNEYIITLGVHDFEKVRADPNLTPSSFARYLADYIDEQGWQTYGDVVVRFERLPNLHTGQFRARGAVNPDVEPRPTLSDSARPQSRQAFTAEPGVPPMTDNSSYHGGQGQGRPGDEYDRYGRPQDEPRGGQDPQGGQEARGGYPDQQQGGYPPGQGYDQRGGYPDQQQGGYPPQGGQQAPGGYPPGQGYDQRGGYPDQQQGGYPAPGGYPAAGGYGGQGYDQGYRGQGGGYPPPGGQQGYGSPGGGYNEYGRGPTRQDEGYAPQAAPEQPRPGYPEQGGYDQGYQQGSQGYGQPEYGQSGGDYTQYAESAPPPGYDQGYQQGGGYPETQHREYEYGQSADYGQAGDYGQQAGGGYGGYGGYGSAGTAVTLQLDDGSGRTYQLRDGSNIVGRGQDAQFRLPDTGVSRRHLEIRWDGQVALLSDLNSTNGTTVNNAPVQEWQLADGDVIRLGHSEIIVRIH
ncbi:DUF3662 and FHA domain-containing protein [Mycobacterium shigaense]|uniref:DUF3662 and FHA domain-containing protein n=1 Tax=Mycobacterium shigaense TaxID=722731 RepID=UPI000E56AAF5|nr:DUF3662 and FHA domain-containing protein [Mycobacterium shigaense]